MATRHRPEIDQQGDDCQCEDCGKKFKFGTEGDNERFCLRCSRISFRDQMDADDYDYFNEAE